MELCSINIYIYICKQRERELYIHVQLNIYIERERESARERERDIEALQGRLICRGLGSYVAESVRVRKHRGRPKPKLSQQHRIIHMGGYKNYGPLWGPLNTRCRIILRTQEGSIILTTTHVIHGPHCNYQEDPRPEVPKS